MAGGFDYDSPQRNLNLFQSIAKFNEIWQRLGKIPCHSAVVVAILREV
jgi:hypothetical protein